MILILCHNILDTLVGEVNVSLLPILGPGEEETRADVLAHLVEGVNTRPDHFVLFEVIVWLLPEALAPLLFGRLKEFTS